MKDDAEHPDHMSVSRYRACADTVMNARLFLWHSLGLNQRFIGDGWAKNPLTGVQIAEYLTANAPLAEVVGQRIFDLTMTA